MVDGIKPEPPGQGGHSESTLMYIFWMGAQIKCDTKMTQGRILARSYIWCSITPGAHGVPCSARSDTKKASCPHHLGRPADCMNVNDVYLAEGSIRTADCLQRRAREHPIAPHALLEQVEPVQV